MKYAHLLSAFYGEPWALRPDFHANYSQILLAHLAGEPVPEAVFERRREPLAALPGGRPIVGPVDGFGNPIIPQMAVENGVAVVPVYGILGRRLALLDLACGGADYEHLAAFFDMALADSAVRLVVLDLDTPGGRCLGLPECGAALARLAAAKPVLAYTSGLCCSAGYYLAAIASEIYASPSAQVGNVGVRSALIDDTEAWRMEGRRLELLASGPLKAGNSPGVPITDEVRAFYRAKMERCRDDFFSLVREQRPQFAEENFDGRWLDGAEAPAAGMTDGVALTLAEVVGAAMQLARLDTLPPALDLAEPDAHPRR